MRKNKDKLDILGPPPRLYASSAFIRDTELPIRVKFTPQGPVEEHRHEFSELVVVTNGSGEHCLDGRRHTLVAGDVFLVKPGQIHGYGASNGLAIVNILYDAPKLAFPSYDIAEIPGYYAFFELEPRRRSDGVVAKGRLRLNLEQLNAVSHMAKTLEKEIREKAPGYRVAAITELVRLRLFLARCYDRNKPPRSGPLLRLSKALRYIEEHSQEPLTLKKIAAVAGASPRHADRLFKELTGYSAVQYLIRARIERAAEWLEAGDDIAAVAYRTGFSDSGYFARQFKKVIGLSPRAFKKKAVAP